MNKLLKKHFFKAISDLNQELKELKSEEKTIQIIKLYKDGSFQDVKDPHKINYLALRSDEISYRKAVVKYTHLLLSKRRLRRFWNAFLERLKNNLEHERIEKPIKGIDGYEPDFIKISEMEDRIKFESDEFDTLVKCGPIKSFLKYIFRRRTFWVVFILCLIIALFLIIINNISTSTTPAQTVDYVSLGGNFFGSLIGVIGAYIVAKLSIKDTKEDNLKQRIYEIKFTQLPPLIKVVKELSSSFHYLNFDIKAYNNLLHNIHAGTVLPTRFLDKISSSKEYILNLNNELMTQQSLNSVFISNIQTSIFNCKTLINNVIKISGDIEIDLIKQRACSHQGIAEYDKINNDLLYELTLLERDLLNILYDGLFDYKISKISKEVFMQYKRR